MKEKEKLRVRRKWKSRVLSMLLAMLMVATSVSWLEMEVQAGLVSNPAHTVVATYECGGGTFSSDAEFVGRSIKIDNDTLAAYSSIGATSVYKYIHKGESMNFEISHVSSCKKKSASITVNMVPVTSQTSTGVAKYYKRLDNGASLADSWTADADYRLKFIISNGDTIYIYAEPVSVWFSSTSIPSTLSLAPNKTYQLSAAAGANRLELSNGYVSDSNCTGITWSSSNTSVAKVDSTGKVTAVAPGTATITAKTNYGTNSKSCTVTVLNHKWSYSAAGNTVTAKCVENDSCEYHSGLTYTLSATNSTYDAGTSYNTSLVKAVNNITSVTGASPSAVTYYTSYTDASTNTLTNAANSGASTVGGAPKNAGTYYAVASVGGATAKAEFTIAKSARSCELSMGEYAYGQSDVEPSLTYADQLSDTLDGTAKTADEIVTYSYRKADASDDTYTTWVKGTTGQSLSAGNYILKADIAETDNYKGKTLTREFTVTPTDMTEKVTAPTDKTMTYNGKSQTIDPVSVSGIDTAKVYYTDQKNPTDTDYTETLSDLAKKDAGQYVISYKVVDTAGNYNTCYGSTALTIKPVELEAGVTLASAKTYDGKDDAEVTAVDLTDASKTQVVDGEKITIGLSAKYDSKNVGSSKVVTIYTSTPTITYADGSNTGNYKVKFRCKDQTSASYVDTNLTTTADITAKTADLDWSGNANDGAYTYTGKSQGVTARITNLIEGDTASLTYAADADAKVCNTATKVGTYTARVESIDNENYVLPQESACKKTWSIAYLEITDDALPTGNQDWRNGVTIGKDGYEVSLENDSSWVSTPYTYNTEGTYDLIYYVKQTSTGYITDQRTVQFKIDTTAPSGTITVEKGGTSNIFKAFLHTISFGYFYKDGTQVTIAATDTIDGKEGCGVQTVEYQLVDADKTYDAAGTWNTYTEPFSIDANSKKAVYARITDKSGNQTVINTDGLVVYTDATASDTITFTKTSTTDITTAIDVSDNTIVALTIRGAENAESTEVAEQTDGISNYSVNADKKLVLAASYLQTLPAGSYTLSASYNPNGIAYTQSSKGDAPDTSEIALTVEKAAGSITDISDISKTYDDTPVTAPTYTKVAGDIVTIEYKKASEADTAYTTTAPSACGDYVVRIRADEDANYKAVSATKSFSIKPLDAEDAVITGTKGDNGWYTSGITICPPTGYKIATAVSTEESRWQTSLSYDDSDANTQTVTYYLRQDGTGKITAAKTATFRIDQEIPTGSITVKDNILKKIVNKITFGYFFKDTVDVKITGSDGISGVANIQYQKAATESSYDVDGEWTTADSLTINANDKGAIYARITDQAGNFVIINADGIVVYTDATGQASAEFVRTSEKDLVTDVDTHGNTVASLVYRDASDADATAQPVDATGYEIGVADDSQDRLILKNEFLKTLAVGTYTLTVTYNPMGETYQEDDTQMNQAPDVSVITLSVIRAEGSIKDISALSKTYDGKTVSDPTFTTTNDTTEGRVTYQYKQRNDTTYTDKRPVTCGDYTVQICVSEDADYEAVVATADFSIAHHWSDWQVVSAATAKTVGSKARTCEGCGKMQYCMIPKTGEDETYDSAITIGNGTVESAIEITKDASFTEAVLNNKTEELVAAEGIFTPKEQTAVEKGATAKIWVEISGADEIESADKKNMETKAKELLGEKVSDLFYFDANLYHSITRDGVTTTTSISDPQINIKVSLKLPEVLIQTDANVERTYMVLRLHDGQVDAIEASYDEESGMLTFETDRFSTYAIAYVDRQVATDRGVDTTTITSPLTADGSVSQNFGRNWPPLLVAMVGTTVVLLSLRVWKRKKNAEED